MLTEQKVTKMHSNENHTDTHIVRILSHTFWKHNKRNQMKNKSSIALY